MNVACDLGDDAWRQLGVEALRQGTTHVHLQSGERDTHKEMIKYIKTNHEI